MKRPFSFILFAVIFFNVVYAQGSLNGTIRFMNIPIDGPEKNMKQQLEEKGFKYNMFEACYQGQFNGKNVSVLISTNHNLVDRICVIYPDMSETVIKSEYNRLLEQFQNNNKYLSLPSNKAIPDEENFKYEMSLHNKVYSCSFLYLSPDLFSEDERSCLRSHVEQTLDSPESSLGDINPEIMDCFSQRENDILPEDKLLNLFTHIRDGNVFFVLNENYGNYRIVLYYDNILNRPHGEDL